MWKKEDAPTPSSTPPSEGRLTGNRPARESGSGERATIGPSISIRGEVTGDEDLLIQGRVDGSVHLKQHSVTVGPEGQVKAGIVARVVVVEGTVEGNLTADERVILRSNSSVDGDITAPRVVLEDGARFRGGVDMGESVERSKSTSASVSALPAKAPDRGTSSGDGEQAASPKTTAPAGAQAGSRE